MIKKFLSLIFIGVLFSSCGNSSQTTGSTKISEDIDYSSLDNKCVGWGFRKTENGAEFTAQQHEIMREYGCIYQGNNKDKVLYLTFDEGYEKGYTPLILDTLREKNVPAAFFVTGAYVKSEPDLVKRMAREGHIIGNHSANHPSMPSVSCEEIEEELNELDRLVYSVCKQNTKFFRPPKGEYSTRTLAKVRDMGYINTFWSFAYVDWNDTVSAKEAEENMKKMLHNGNVILLHAVSRGNAEALGNAIDSARREGFVFKSLDYYK